MDQDQVAVCARYGVPFIPADPFLKLGISESALQGEEPLNGLRHPPENSTCGWYIWAGPHFQDVSDFFKPIHLSHMPMLCPAAVPYLGLPPGWRFLIAPNHEDVWFDPSLLNVY